MTQKEWKYLYIEIDEYYNHFISRWRKFDFRYPEQHSQNADAVKGIMNDTSNLILSTDELCELFFEDMDSGQRTWMEITGLTLDTTYIRHIPILLHKIEHKINGKKPPFRGSLDKLKSLVSFIY